MVTMVTNCQESGILSTQDGNYPEPEVNVQLKEPNETRCRIHILFLKYIISR